MIKSQKENLTQVLYLKIARENNLTDVFSSINIRRTWLVVIFFP